MYFSYVRGKVSLSSVVVRVGTFVLVLGSAHGGAQLWLIPSKERMPIAYFEFSFDSHKVVKVYLCSRPRRGGENGTVDVHTKAA